MQNAGKMWVAIEITAFVAIALLSKLALDPFIWRYAGPVSLIGTIVTLSVYLHFRGLSWRSMGLVALPSSRGKLLLIPQAILTFLTVLIIIKFLTFGLESAGFEFMSEKAQGETDRWGDISGNLEMYLLLLGLSIVSAGFAEEMFFRGYLISRIQAIFGSSLWATVLSIFLPALLFGYVHIYYQGLQGFVNAGVIGVIFGTLFLKFKRNLWPLILAHAFINCLGYTAEFMGWEI
jgi:membrane protease YdiL (CAAX protease family)